MYILSISATSSEFSRWPRHLHGSEKQTLWVRSSWGWLQWVPQRCREVGKFSHFFRWMVNVDSCFQDTERGLVDGEKGAFSLRDFHDFEHSHSKSATASTSLSCSIPKVSSQIGSYSGYSGSSHQALGDFNQKSIRRNQRPKKGPLLWSLGVDVHVLVLVFTFNTT